MKKVIVILVMMVSFVGLSQEKPKKNKEVVFKVNGNCEMCEKTYRKSSFFGKRRKKCRLAFRPSRYSFNY